jgi:putative spermidine/putrescine transport system substrate-binding protein
MTNTKKTRLMAAAGLAAACCALFSGTANAAEALTLASFGGAYGESQKKAYALPFQELTGTKNNDD